MIKHNWHIYNQLRSIVGPSYLVCTILTITEWMNVWMDKWFVSQLPSNWHYVTYEHIYDKYNIDSSNSKNNNKNYNNVDIPVDLPFKEYFAFNGNSY